MGDPAADLTVVAPDPRFGGGAHAQTEAFLAAAAALGRRTELVFPPHPVLAGSRFSVDRVEAVRQLRAARTLAPRVAAAPDVWVVSTTATHGGAAARSGRAYRAWIGTSLDVEWRGRAAGLPRSRRAAFALSLGPLRRLEREVLRGASELYATSAASRAGVAAAAGIDPAAIGILPIPVDVEDFAPEDDAVWAARLDAPVLAFVGRAWDPRKNVRLLLDALPAIRARLPGARLRLIGEPPTGTLPVGVEATGKVASVAEHLRTASLFVLPSWQEGFGIAAAEALASGVPVLTTPSGGPEELVTASGAGVVLSSFAADELAATAAAMLTDADTLVAMRARGRAYVQREHAPARLVELLRTII
ncbi:MAG TPA: glycosyltransferase family 4 protein [Gaiellaceae bacterium]|nr:glycosyltransferase family 4 protein [Gaiellaceae bacterium]